MRRSRRRPPRRAAIFRRATTRSRSTRRLHDRDRQPLLADGTRHAMVVRRARLRGRRTPRRGHGDERDEAIANGIDARVVRDTVTAATRSSRTPSTGTPRMPQARSGTSARTPRSSRTARSSRARARSRRVSTAPYRDRPAGRPGPGMEYRQEYYAGEAEDNGAVLSTDEIVEVPYGRSTAPCSRETRMPSNRMSRN